MNLVPATQAPDEDLRFLVRSVSVAKIYYVWTGRNAWWSTWSTRYSPGCFHTTLESAKDFCESKRVQGTVFYIDELPSLAFCASDRVLVASEINTDRFLGKFDQVRLAAVTTAFPVSTMTLRQMYYVFRAESRLWPSDYPKKNSMLLSFGSGTTPPQKVEISDQLTSYKSYAQGANYFLCWENRPFTKDRSVIHAIASALEERMNLC